MFVALSSCYQSIQSINGMGGAIDMHEAKLVRHVRFHVYVNVDIFLAISWNMPGSALIQS